MVVLAGIFELQECFGSTAGRQLALRTRVSQSAPARLCLAVFLARRRDGPGAKNEAQNPTLPA